MILGGCFNNVECAYREGKTATREHSASASIMVRYIYPFRRLINFTKTDHFLELLDKVGSIF